MCIVFAATNHSKYLPSCIGWGWLNGGMAMAAALAIPNMLGLGHMKLLVGNLSAPMFLNKLRIFGGVL